MYLLPGNRVSLSESRMPFYETRAKRGDGVVLPRHRGEGRASIPGVRMSTTKPAVPSVLLRSQVRRHVELAPVRRCPSDFQVGGSVVIKGDRSYVSIHPSLAIGAGDGPSPAASDAWTTVSLYRCHRTRSTSFGRD